MKLTKKIIMVLAIVVMAMGTLALTGCGKKFDMKKMAGKYELVEMTNGDETYSKEDLDSLKSYGFTITMELNDDGTGKMNSYGEEQELTYDKDNITVDGDAAAYTMDGNKITVESDGTKMVFEKAE